MDRNGCRLPSRLKKAQKNFLTHSLKYKEIFNKKNTLTKETEKNFWKNCKNFKPAWGTIGDAAGDAIFSFSLDVSLTRSNMGILASLTLSASEFVAKESSVFKFPTSETTGEIKSIELLLVERLSSRSPNFLWICD